MMKLRKVRVTAFRSVADSGWIETGDVTALIGTNESGKTNLLLPLWKLNPAKEGAVQPTADYPRKHFNQIRNLDDKPVFIDAVFEVDDDLADELARVTGLSAASFREVSVSRKYDGGPLIDFPGCQPPRKVPAARVHDLVQEARQELEGLTPLKSELELRERIVGALRQSVDLVGDGHADRGRLETVASTLGEVTIADAPKTSMIVPRFERLRTDLAVMIEEVSRPHPRDVKAATALVLKHLPKFVYYSNYGNLDGEIYLPQVIQDMKRKDLGSKAAAKARTLRVLFKFVGLEPAEILELGLDFKDPANPSREPTPAEIAAITEKKKQRSILLQSASALLTERFRNWWKQGNYRFRFEADGNHFRIWVSDDRRPEEVELENRSTGLQWFLSFYLIFLVESEEAHEGAILLLDEPGLSLHPLAQKDLSAFFDSLATTNQLIYTTHSPFLVDADRLERARKVYVGEDGTSKATADLRGTDGDPTQRGAGYAVLAALGLSVADSLLIGCTPVIVEGLSDQHYLTALKSVLVGCGRLRPARELIFPPAGGAKTVRAVCSVLGARDEDLPMALFDSDTQGRRFAQDLRTGLYQGAPERVIEVGQFVGMEGAEIEDLIPAALIVQQLDRWQRGPEQAFADVHVSGRPIVPQIESWAHKHGLSLPPGWKVELAKRVKYTLLQRGARAVSEDILEVWATMFNAFERRVLQAESALSAIEAATTR